GDPQGQDPRPAASAGQARPGRRGRAAAARPGRPRARLGPAVEVRPRPAGPHGPVRRRCGRRPRRAEGQDPRAL
ncbi:MAG: hypothetical protein AVDCRST_MAG30-49, partial [uncultured Solirubrobacteraceae bacterium]